MSQSGFPHEANGLRLEQPCGLSALDARAWFAGTDLCVLVTGGDAPHVGCVCLGIPRPSLNDASRRSATVSTLNAAGHKDDHVGNLFAHRLAASLGCTVSVTCGIHLDGAASTHIADLLQAAHILLDRLESALLAV